ncbi:Restriction of telomere capping protein 5 [Sporothrix epigloea]|uniref:Restriction of telomere capping protein 5 n=1 Tax=Sporothrix epigloea TaxID=1892477 RepID=A0ABP0DMY5_9PEZI
MGQGQSAPPPIPRTHEELANRFATKCYTSLELYSLKDNFRSLADIAIDRPLVLEETGHGNDPGEGDNNHGRTGREDMASQSNQKQHVVRYLKEDSVARFLAIPDILGASPVVFQMLTYLGAFPFLEDAPAVLGLEQLVIVVTLLTNRQHRALAQGSSNRRSLLFQSLAVHDRKLSDDDTVETAAETSCQPQTQPASADQISFGEATEEDRGDVKEDDSILGHIDDELVLAALAALEYVDGSAPSGPLAATQKTLEMAAAVHGARIPADNFHKLLMLLLLVAPLGPQEQLSLYTERFTGDALESLRATAQCVLATFLNVETSPGIQFVHFDAIVPACFPFLFSGLQALFEHFLFSKNLDFSRNAPDADNLVVNTDDNLTQTHTQTAVPVRRKSSAAVIPGPKTPPPPLILTDNSYIMNLNILSQLSFFIPGTSLFRRLRPLYSGDSDGFSMGSFETRVFNWRAPTILLVKGSRISDRPHGQEAAFDSALPPRRLPHGNSKPAIATGRSRSSDTDDDETLIFGAYISQPWRLTHRECFGDSETILFQLSPVHDVFGASTINQDYVAFVKPSAGNQHAGGIGFGCPSPTGTAAQARLKQHQHPASSMEGILPLGPLSLMIDANLEFGVMTHDRGRATSGAPAGSGAGGAFHPSAARMFSFQDRFSISALEVWGCGGDAEAQAQAERWAWEAREAEARRRINLGTGDIEADRALLEMAGLIGGNRSGGSMG